MILAQVSSVYFLPNGLCAYVLTILLGSAITEAHTCDKSCKLHCAGGSDDIYAGNGGHRRFLMRLLAEAHFGGWASQITDMTDGCPLSGFEHRLSEIDDACCVERDVECHDGVPDSCPYYCGRL